MLIGDDFEDFVDRGVWGILFNESMIIESAKII
jgi:hypothetical protein